MHDERAMAGPRNLPPGPAWRLARSPEGRMRGPARTALTLALALGLLLSSPAGAQEPPTAPEGAATTPGLDSLLKRNLVPCRGKALESGFLGFLNVNAVSIEFKGLMWSTGCAGRSDPRNIVDQ